MSLEGSWVVFRRLPSHGWLWTPWEVRRLGGRVGMERGKAEGKELGQRWRVAAGHHNSTRCALGSELSFAFLL